MPACHPDRPARPARLLGSAAASSTCPAAQQPPPQPQRSRSSKKQPLQQQQQQHTDAQQQVAHNRSSRLPPRRVCVSRPTGRAGPRSHSQTPLPGRSCIAVGSTNTGLPGVERTEAAGRGCRVRTPQRASACPAETADQQAQQQRDWPAQQAAGRQAARLTPLTPSW